MSRKYNSILFKLLFQKSFYFHILNLISLLFEKSIPPPCRTDHPRRPTLFLKNHIVPLRDTKRNPCRLQKSLMLLPTTKLLRNATRKKANLGKNFIFYHSDMVSWYSLIYFPYISCSDIDAIYNTISLNPSSGTN